MASPEPRREPEPLGWLKGGSIPALDGLRALSIGMVQLPPAMVSAPFKILLFVLVDGWNLTVGSLMKGFYP